MSTSTAPLRLTPQQYLEAERVATFKSEYFDGEPFAMAGGTRSHGYIQANLYGEFWNHLRGTTCRYFASDTKVWAPEQSSFFYPDLSVVCGPAVYFGGGATMEDVIENPILILEILSPSAEKFDRGRKFRMYRSIPSLKQYVLVAQDEPRVELYSKDPNGFWIYSEYASLDAIADFSAIQVQIALAHIYEQVEFNP
jgi:Uma2 family endonuclease